MSIRVNHIRGATAEVESVTPQMAELGFDTTKNEPHIGNNTVQGGIRLAKKNIREVLVAPQLLADANDYAPAGLKHAGTLVIATDAARDVTGLVPLTVTDDIDGRVIDLYNGGLFNATLKDASAASSAGNRFDFGGSDLVLAPKTSATLRYRKAVTKWELVCQTVGAAVSAGAVIARTLAASSQGLSMVNGTIVPSVSAGALTLAIKTLAGNDPSAADPVLITIRAATLAGGGYSVMSLTAATVLVISAGSSLGATNATAFSLRLVGVNDGGTFRLGVINLGRQGAALPLLKPDQLLNSTAEGGAGAADNANVVYTDAAVASKPFTMLASLDWAAGLAAAGTWDAVPTQIQLFSVSDDLPGHGMVAIAKRAAGMFGGRIVESHAGNAATFAVKTHAGDDPSPVTPVYFVFQTGAGGLVVRTLTAALSLTVSSGSTLGATNASPFRIWLVALDTGSGVALGAVNCVSGTNVMGLQDDLAYSTTAEGGAGAADNAQTIYTTAAQAAKYLCVVGYATYETGLAAAGAWNAPPSMLALWTPGVPRPGQSLQLRFSMSSAGASTTSTAFQPSALTVVLTPQSAVNLTRSTMSGDVLTATGNVCITQLFRGPTGIGLSPGIGGTSGVGFSVAMEIVDAPQTAAALVYNVKFRSGSGGSVQFPMTSSFLCIEEIMG